MERTSFSGSDSDEAEGDESNYDYMDAKLQESHDELIDRINEVQIFILLEMHSVISHATQYRLEAACESLPVICLNIPGFAKKRMARYIELMSHVVRKAQARHTWGTGNVASHVDRCIFSWRLNNIAQFLFAMSRSHVMRRQMLAHSEEEMRYYLGSMTFVDNIHPGDLYNAQTLELLHNFLIDCLGHSMGQNGEPREQSILDKKEEREPIIKWDWKRLCDDEDPNLRTDGMLRLRRARRKHRMSMLPVLYRGESLKPSKKWEKHFEETIQRGKSRRRQSKSEVDKQLFSSSSSSASSDASSNSDDDDDDFIDRRGLTLPRRESIQLGSPITSPRANSMVSLPRRGSFIVRQGKAVVGGIGSMLHLG